MAISITITGDTRELEAALRRLESGVRGTTARVERSLDDTATHSTRATLRMGQAFARLQQDMQARFRAMQTILLGFSGVLATLTAGAGFGALAADAVRTAGSLERLNVQLRFVSGSFEQFQRNQQFIRQFTKDSPFQIGEVTRAFTDLTRRGLDAERALRGIGDVAALTEFPSQALEGMVRAMRQIADLGRLNQEELNQMAEAAGVSTLRVIEELEKQGVVINGNIGDAAISVQQAIEAINRTLADSEGAMQATATTWGTITSSMRDSWTFFQEAIVDGPLFDYIKGLAIVIREELDQATQDGAAAFDRMGAQAVAAFQSMGRAIAVLIDLLHNIIAVGTNVMNFFGELERRGAEVVSGIYNSIGQFFGAENLIGKVQQDTQQAGQAVADALGLTGGALEQFEQVNRRATEALKQGEEARNAALERADRQQQERVKRLQAVYAVPRPGGGRDGAARDAAAEAKRRQQEEERAVRESLQRQQALIAASFDERRRLLDQELADRLQREPRAVEQIAQERKDTRQALAREEAQARLAVEEQLSTDLEQVWADRAKMEQRFAEEALDEQIKQAEDLIKLTEQVNAQIAQRDEQTMDDARKRAEDADREHERHLDQQQRAYESFAERVEKRTADIFLGLIDGSLDVWDFFKQTALRTIAEIAAFAATRTIILPLATAAVGGLGGLVGGATGTGGGGLFDLLGLAGAANQGAGLFGGGGLGSVVGPTSAIGLAMGNLTATLNSAAADVGGFFADTFNLTQTPASGLGTLAGLAGIGGGIFSALNASGTGGRVGGAIGAAGGAAGLVGSLGLGTLAIPGLQPIGLALAAIAPLLGNFLDTVGKPKGPRFVLGELEGLDVVVENGLLQVAGTLSSAVGKAERLPAGQAADQIQDALRAGVQQSVTSMVETINAVALDPDTLIRPTQDALSNALDTALRINSASAENFAKDIAAQTLAVVTQVSANFLGPLGDALQQIFDADLDRQIRLLPRALQLAVAQMNRVNEAINEIEQTGQSDASNVLPQLRDQVASFRKRIIDETVASLHTATIGGLGDFADTLQLAISLPQEVVALHAPLALVQQNAQEVATVFNGLVAEAGRLHTSFTPIGTQITELRTQFNALRFEIAEAGDNIAAAIPLYGELQQVIQAETNLRIQQVQTIAQTLDSIEQALFQQLSPREQRESLLADIAATERELAGQTGLAAADTAGQLATLYQQLLQMGESQENLALVMQGREGLEQLRPMLEQQLVALGGTTDVQQAIRNIQQQALDTLLSMQRDIYALWVSNQQIASSLNLPLPVHIVGAQTGGIVGFARGGVVPAMLEPGEAVFPPMNIAQQHALSAMNRAFPRFGGGAVIPGSGTGDTVPTMLRMGTGVLNRNAVHALRLGRGYQTGGAVQEGGHGSSARESPPVVNHYNVTINGTVRSDQDLRDLKGAVREQFNQLERYKQRLIRGR